MVEEGREKWAPPGAEGQNRERPKSMVEEGREKWAPPGAEGRNRERPGNGAPPGAARWPLRQMAGALRRAILSGQCRA